MLVCIDKITCVRMHRLLEFYWNEQANELEAELARTQDEQTKKQIAWMRETRMAVVVSEEQGEVERFDKWDLDIIPHRRLIKEGMELPASMRDKPSFRNKQRMDLDDAFKEPEHPFRTAIVCAMWLTGFDVPCLSTLYLDKPLKQVAVELLKTLKAGKLRVNQWRDKEATRDAVRVAIRDFLWSDDTGLPADDYSEAEVGTKTDDVFRHVFRVYPAVPSSYYENAA